MNYTLGAYLVWAIFLGAFLLLIPNAPGFWHDVAFYIGISFLSLQSLKSLSWVILKVLS